MYVQCCVLSVEHPLLLLILAPGLYSFTLFSFPIIPLSFRVCSFLMFTTVLKIIYIGFYTLFWKLFYSRKIDKLDNISILMLSSVKRFDNRTISRSQTRRLPNLTQKNPFYWPSTYIWREKCPGAACIFYWNSRMKYSPVLRSNILFKVILTTL